MREIYPRHSPSFKKIYEKRSSKEGVVSTLSITMFVNVGWFLLAYRHPRPPEARNRYAIPAVPRLHKKYPKIWIPQRDPLFSPQISSPPFPPPPFLLCRLPFNSSRILTRFPYSHASLTPRALLSLISVNFSLPALQRRTHFESRLPIVCRAHLPIRLRKNIRLEQNIRMYLLR